jgi:hypothetical protein
MNRAADRRGTVPKTEVGPRAEDTGPVATGIGGTRPVARDRLSTRQPQKAADRCTTRPAAETRRQWLCQPS